ncbi:expressed unknown protein [Seminavis robusta]|uniref:Uncharacterized protein n=1 Tax=Seminavis robusta TaxID=568900 RepID=A0A9N8DX62_9STRA|nr:expressed unknown protein [Seminavis robusta]|eukprot:Sro443_g144060.1 n/a (336) ;mRNA; f:32713-33720
MDNDDNERNERFLSNLRSTNDQRRQKLHRLLAEYDQELEEWKVANPDVTTCRPSLEDHRMSLEVEWDLLQETKEQMFEKSLVHIASVFPDFAESGPSEAVVRHCLLQEYSEQVLESYHDLAETHWTLQKVLEREKAKLELKQTYLKQQQNTVTRLQEQLRFYKQKEETEKETLAETDDKEQNEHQSQVSTLKKQNEWIRGELGYVCQQLMAKLAKDIEKGEAAKQPTESKEQQSSKHKKRKKTKQRDKEGQADETDSKRTSTMEDTVMELVTRLLDNPSNPYVFVGENGNADEANPSNSHDKLGRKEIMEVLIDSGVTVEHQDKSGWVCLTDYRE